MCAVVAAIAALLNCKVKPPAPEPLPVHVVLFWRTFAPILGQGYQKHSQQANFHCATRHAVC